MTAEILAQIKKLENERNIKVLFASESGSRAWGFPSPDSDFDVRFFYTHPQDWYLSLNEPKDIIDLGVNDLLDINGWDIRKALRLMKKSNVSPLEWLQSPIVYYKDEAFHTLIKPIEDSCFSPIASIHHYLSMAKRFYEICADEKTVKLKSWFYGLRAALNALWILEQQTLPPIHFPDCFTFMVKEDSLTKKIQHLIKLKASKNESYLQERDTDLLGLMKDAIDRCEAGFRALPGNRVDQKALNEIFRKIIKAKM